MCIYYSRRINLPDIFSSIKQNTQMPPLLLFPNCVIFSKRGTWPLEEKTRLPQGGPRANPSGRGSERKPVRVGGWGGLWVRDRRGKLSASRQNPVGFQIRGKVGILRTQWQQ